MTSWPRAVELQELVHRVVRRFFSSCYYIVRLLETLRSFDDWRIDTTPYIKDNSRARRVHPPKGLRTAMLHPRVVLQYVSATLASLGSGLACWSNIFCLFPSPLAGTVIEGTLLSTAEERRPICCDLVGNSNERTVWQ